jgi:hypothetical protein
MRVFPILALLLAAGAQAQFGNQPLTSPQAGIPLECQAAMESLRHANTAERRKAKRQACGEAEPTKAEIDAKRERVLRAMQIDATNRNTMAIQNAPDGDSGGKLKMECKRNPILGTLECNQR